MNEPNRNIDCRSYEPRPFQYSLRMLFIVTFLFAMFCGLAVQVGLPAAIGLVWLGLIVWWACFERTRPLAFATVLLSLLVLCMCPFPPSSRGPGRQARCMNNQKEIAAAIIHYENDYGQFPPPYIADESGRPIHSWRVLILPYLGKKGLYEQYNFDEPWDGPNNRKLADKCPSVFQCPSGQRGRRRSSETSYVAVVGPETMWPEDKSINFSDVVDPQKTILLVEMADSEINWLEPRDLHVDQMAPAINPKKAQGISSNHPSVLIISFADGHVQKVRADLSPEELRAMLSRDGGKSGN